MTSRALFQGTYTFGLVSFALLGCESGEASEAWSKLATCLAGPAAQSPVLERAQAIRRYQLANGTASASKDMWPKRCSGAADDLYAMLDKSGKTGLLKRKLTERLGCKEQKGSCAVPADGSLASIATELWESAKSAQLELKPVQGVPAPAAAPPPSVDAKGWKTFGPKPLRLSGPVLTTDGRALVVLKAAEGKGRPIGCEFASDFAKVRCLPENSTLPELPLQTVEVVNDEKGMWASALNDTGLIAYDLESGKTSPVGGRTGRLIREGVVVERAAKDDISGGPSLPTSKAQAQALAKSASVPKDEGFVFRELANGKASKDVPLKIPAPVGGDPIAIGNQIVFLVPKEGGTNLGVVSVKGGRASPAKILEGVFSGSIRTCRRGDDLAVAVHAGRKDQGRAQATAGDGKTAVTVALYRKAAWSKPVEATIPFERATESDLICTPNGATIAWAQKTTDGTSVGRIDCASDACVTSVKKMSTIDPVYFWATLPLGEKTLLLYRSTLGETRFRVAPLHALADAPDTILFDGPDFGGPTTGELLPVVSDEAALLMFRGEQAVAVRVGADGKASVVVP
jgi:hypothetical protein